MMIDVSEVVVVIISQYIKSKTLCCTPKNDTGMSTNYISIKVGEMNNCNTDISKNTMNKLYNRFVFI